MSIVEGFGGMRIKDNKLNFEPRIPNQWEAYSFKVNFRHQIITVNVSQQETVFEIDGTKELEILVNGKPLTITPNSVVNV
jgi:maltose phosphorylase